VPPRHRGPEGAEGEVKHERDRPETRRRAAQKQMILCATDSASQPLARARTYTAPRGEGLFDSARTSATVTSFWRSGGGDRAAPWSSFRERQDPWEAWGSAAWASGVGLWGRDGRPDEWAGRDGRRHERRQAKTISYWTRPRRNRDAAAKSGLRVSRLRSSRPASHCSGISTSAGASGSGGSSGSF